MKIKWDMHVKIVQIGCLLNVDFLISLSPLNMQYQVSTMQEA